MLYTIQDSIIHRLQSYEWTTLNYALILSSLEIPIFRDISEEWVQSSNYMFR